MNKINNSFYNELGRGWVDDAAHPVALLRAENRLRNPWIASKLPVRCRILDMGCGAGFLTNELVLLGHQVHGIDLSEQSLEIARQTDGSNKVQYSVADAAALPFKNG